VRPPFSLNSIDIFGLECFWQSFKKSETPKWDGLIISSSEMQSHSESDLLSMEARNSCFYSFVWPFSKNSVSGFNPDYAAWFPRWNWFRLNIQWLWSYLLWIWIQAIGVVLNAALLITPAHARFGQDRLGVLVILAGVFSAISGVFWTYIHLWSAMPNALGGRLPFILVALSLPCSCTKKGCSLAYISRLLKKPIETTC